MGNKDVLYINELEEIKGNPWDCDAWMFLENNISPFRKQYHSELNKKFVITERMKIDDFYVANSDVTCVLWHKNAFFTIYRGSQVVKNCVEFGLSDEKVVFSGNTEINTAVIYKEFLLLGTNN